MTITNMAREERKFVIVNCNAKLRLCVHGSRKRSFRDVDGSGTGILRWNNRTAGTSLDVTEFPVRKAHEELSSWASKKNEMQTSARTERRRTDGRTTLASLARRALQKTRS